jgi:hypothetical protein
MTTYLTKIDGDKTYHFRVTIKNNGVDIVYGVFYNCIGKHWEDCGDITSAVVRQKQLVNEKINEGFQVTKFKKTPENTVNIYDKAKWHFEGKFPKDLDNFQAYIHTGMYLGWLIDNDLVSKEFKTEHKKEILQFKQQALTGAQIFECCCDGVLTLEDLTEIGNRFSLPYINFDSGQYLDDYEKTLAKKLSSLYEVNDNWDNYHKLKPVIDNQFSQWKNGTNKKPFWKFW